MKPKCNLHVWDASVPCERAAWIDCWQRWPDREVFAHPNYLSLFAEDGVKALCACSQIGQATILYPFLWRSLEGVFSHCESAKGKSDIITPYGYGGAFRWGEMVDPFEFWDEFDRWAIANAVVSEVVRFSLFEESLLPYAGTRESISTNIVRNLDLDEESLWRDVEHKVRKNVNRARSEGVRIRIDEQGACIDDFLKIYESTMNRRSAEGNYYFRRKFFEDIQTGLSGHFAYFFAEHNEQVVSTELVLVSNSRVYSFLGGTLESAFHLRPNDLLKFEVMKWAMQAGKSNYILGGGYCPDDGIFRYKESFAPHGQKQFILGSRVYCSATYEALVEGRRAAADTTQQAWTPRANYFPLYRA